jgi:hypothetical protein
MNPQLQTPARNAFLRRQRRLVLQEDAHAPLDLMGLPDLALDDWLRHRFHHIDGSKVDTIIWDMGMESEAWRVYLKGELLPLRDHPGITRWADAGQDWVGACLATARRLGIESFWNHRISEIDTEHPWKDGYNSVPWDDPRRNNYLKLRHPDWLVKSWWPHGNWNLAHPEVRRHKTAVLRELLTNYDLDGLQLDFARHTPFLPPGHEWEQRDAATAFVRGIRTMIQEIESARGRPVMLIARVAETLAGNRLDGIDVHQWAGQGLVDGFTLGGRATVVDFEGYRRLSCPAPLLLWPMMDGHHTPEGYHRPPIEYLRGVFSNWREQGAASIGLFNWIHQNKISEPPHPPNLAMLQEAADPAALAAGPGLYAAESRGEYPWAQNYLYRSDDKPLPARAAHGGGAVVPVEIYRPEPVDRLWLMIEGMESPEVVENVLINGKQLDFLSASPAEEDRYFGFDPHAPRPRFPTITCSVQDGVVKRGRNLVTVLFRANQSPAVFTIRRLEAWCAGFNPPSAG